MKVDGALDGAPVLAPFEHDKDGEHRRPRGHGQGGHPQGEGGFAPEEVESDRIIVVPGAVTQHGHHLFFLQHPYDLEDGGGGGVIGVDIDVFDPLLRPHPFPKGLGL